MQKNDDNPITLKKVAEEYQCAASSLKNNIKAGRLPAVQENEKAAYLVCPSEVEKFLKETKGIASIFHPSDASPAATEGQPPQATDTPKPPAEPKPVQVTPSAHDADSSESTTANEADAVPKESCPRADSATADATDPPESEQDGKPRRKRRRGKRRGKGTGNGSTFSPSVQQATLQALAGTTVEDRLRLTACLNELASLVASAKPVSNNI